METGCNICPFDVTFFFFENVGLKKLCICNLIVRALLPTVLLLGCIMYWFSSVEMCHLPVSYTL